MATLIKTFSVPSVLEYITQKPSDINYLFT